MKSLMLLLWTGTIVFDLVRMCAPDTVSSMETFALCGLAALCTVAYVLDWADVRG